MSTEEAINYAVGEKEKEGLAESYLVQLRTTAA